MRLKSYFASTVEEAISLASRELGEEAMLVYSRETLPEARPLGRYEVVFALEPDTAPPAAATPAPETQTGTAFLPQAPEAWQLGPAMEELRAGLGSDLRREIEEMRLKFARLERLLIHTAGAIASSRWSAPAEDLYQELLIQELPADLAASVVSAVENAPQRAGGWDRRAALTELAAEIAALPRGEEVLRAGKAHLFVGPPGGGKSTMLIKLAVALGLERRLPVMLVSLDSRRIGGTDQLKTFAQILGVPFAAIDHRTALERLLEGEGRRHTLFLDTPGFSEEDLTEQAWLPALARDREGFQTHLVLPAHVRTQEAARLIRRYESFRLASLMLTHTEDTVTMGGLIGEALRCGLPLSYCGTGPSIPEDLCPAGAEWLARRILPAEPVAKGEVHGEAASRPFRQSVNGAVA